jgi:hypothetical protein
MHTVQNMRFCPFELNLSFHTIIIYIYRVVKAIDHCFLFIKKIGKPVKDFIGLGMFRKENVEAIDALFCDWGCIRVAIDSFSYEKMLGKGGFGYVFKVISIALIGI